jgi:hypothetical protein
VRPYAWDIYEHGLLRCGVRLGENSARESGVRFLDTVILDATEWLCRKFQLATGRTNVWVAVQLTNLSIVVYFVWAAVYFWRTPVMSRLAVALFCAALLYALSQTLLKDPIEAYENSAFHRVAKGLRNPRRIRDSVLRTSFLTLSIVLAYPILFLYFNSRAAVFLLTYSLIVLTTVILYVLACDPLPPCAGKVREWLRGSAAAPAASPESTRLTVRGVVVERPIPRRDH